MDFIVSLLGSFFFKVAAIVGVSGYVLVQAATSAISAVTGIVVH